MRTLLFKLAFLAGCMSLAACSLTMNGDNTQGTAKKPPVVVENATESTKSQPAKPVSAPEQPPKDQNTLQSMSLSSTPVTDEPVGGSLEKSMDEDDKIKMSRALDKAPGKTTSWTNNRTGVKYDVTPIRKVVLKDNPYCRVYQMTSSRGSHTKEVSGTACIADDGNWHPI